MTRQRPVPPAPLAAFLLALLTAAALALSPARASTAVDELVAAHRDAAPAHPIVRTTPVAPPASPASVPGRWMRVAGSSAAEPGQCPALLQHAFTAIQGGASQSMCQYQGKVLLVVNTASQCGFTYQYEGLEALYGKYRDRGLVVIGFPSNDFGGQEPGTNKEIAEFCRTKYGVQFPMFEKQSVTRLAENPFYAALAAKTGEKPRWNFHKYVIDRTGERVQSFGSNVEPGSRDLVGTIERLLAERPPARRS